MDVDRVYRAWVGGVASRYKGLRVPRAAAMDWAERFARGIGAAFDREWVSDALDGKKGGNKGGRRR